MSNFVERKYLKKTLKCCIVEKLAFGRKKRIMEVLLEALTVDKINLRYYKIIGNQKYGVKIVKKEGIFEECAEIKEITEDEKDIEIFLEKLIAGKVTPLTLRYIIEDRALEYIRKNFKMEKVRK